MIESENHSVTLVYDDVPPSLNRIGTRGTHWPVTKAKRRWQEILERLLQEAKVPRGFDRATATAVLRFPLQRTRDEGNFRWCLEKALGDAITNGGWLLDDDADRFTFGELLFESGPKRTCVHLIFSRICEE